MISESGGTPTALTEIDTKKGELYHTWPSFTEDGEHFIYFRSGPPDVQGIYVGSIDAKPAQQSRDRILATDVAASFANGYLFFVRADTLLAQPLDPRSLKVKGEPVPVAESLELNWFRTGVFWASSGGVLAYRSRGVSRRSSTHRGSTGRERSSEQWDSRVRSTRSVCRPMRCVPSSAMLFYGTAGDLWMVDLVSGRRTRFTFSQRNYSPAVWSPDGSQHRVCRRQSRGHDLCRKRPPASARKRCF